MVVMVVLVVLVVMAVMGVMGVMVVMVVIMVVMVVRVVMLRHCPLQTEHLVIYITYATSRRVEQSCNVGKIKSLFLL